MACYTREDEDAFGSQQLSQDRDYFSTYVAEEYVNHQVNPPKKEEAREVPREKKEEEEESVLLKKQIQRVKRRNALLKLCHPYAK